jgi:cohesin complex subunit SCC1
VSPNLNSTNSAMLLTELILSKKGPLAKVWISAHQERKLSKAQTLQVDVGETVGECWIIVLLSVLSNPLID